MLVVDVMHEVELGVWKALFIQILRLLDSSDKGAINKLDERCALVSFARGISLTTSLHRYRNMPTFGRDTIRRFTNNVSEMKQLAARDWEDILQVRWTLSVLAEECPLMANSSWPVLHRCVRRITAYAPQRSPQQTIVHLQSVARPG